MPVAIYLLGAAIFAQGTSELILSGLLTDIASDLNITIPQAGLLTSGFAVGMAIGAPILAVLTLRWDRRKTLLALLAAFTAAHILGALAPTYELLLLTRFAGAFAYAGFWAVASVTAITMAGPQARGKAMSIVAGGLTIATVVGVPAGTVIGQHFGWRAAFWTVAALTALSALGVAKTVPSQKSTPEDRPRLRTELRTFAGGRIWIAYVATAMSSGAVMATFTYLGALLTGVTDIPTTWVPAVLVLFGLGSLLGITLGGRFADAHPFATLYTGFGGVIAAAVLLFTGATNPTLTLIASFLLAVSGFATNPAVNVLVFSLANNAPTLAGATNITAFNVGITLAPWASGLLIGAHLGLPTITWISATLATIGLTATLTSQSLHHRYDRPAKDTVTAHETQTDGTGDKPRLPAGI
ncbi:Cmx/CmrA family chloramphenicol efflux MFS transporter [Stackebrandtia nassauensis]|uniref:Major facilitator superfamily MFS_1 n=1 Tax=Stackebrandtia nassauensis (strain DSM 44728 / CIP 108903 / NRRL B-16338 / NBRC 102104 / LLR-40K-21) TaxID=446470 RepID=D3Q4E1_STANL|nr:Cmx/CmrA family chloramphenicol efflux MFS transporter [Stackebrandtia nassauensis]ADD40101.1 major facilitator superfamily MFS_1 [Stackebrandtia nassauensis DSM 44728]